MTIKWTAKIEALLGTMSDKDLADHLNLPSQGVLYCYWRRVDLDIPAYGEPNSEPSLNTQIDALLETTPDQYIARHLRIPLWTVHWRRKEQGLSPFEPKRCSTLDTLLGTMSDGDLASQLDLDLWTVFYRRSDLNISPYELWAPEREALLGTIPDADLANLLNILESAVQRKRRELNISAFGRVLPKNLTVHDAEATRIYNARKRHRIAQVANTLTEEQWVRALKWFDHRCAYCDIKSQLLVQEHLKPLSRGGPRTALNIIPACTSCNSQKHALQAHVWIKRKFGDIKGGLIIARIVSYLKEVSQQGGSK